MKTEDRINTPANIVTIIRICLIPLFLAILLAPWPSWFGLDFVGNHEKAIIATIVFVVISATDWVDGYLARSRKEVTTFGKFMDPLADKMLVITALLSLIELDVLPAWPVIIIIAREFIVSGIRMLAANKGVVIAASWFGKAKTATQIIAVVLFLLKEGVTIYDASDVMLNPLYITAWTVMIISLILTVVSMIDYIKAFKKILEGSKDEKNGLNNIDQEISVAAKNLIEELEKKNLSVITAESLTGGMISCALTSIPGSSSVVLGGISSYAYELKSQALGVDLNYLNENGAVNETTAKAMVIGASKFCDASCCVSVTGIAGPTGEENGNPVGTVFIGIYLRSSDEVYVDKFIFSGNREDVRKKTTLKAIKLLTQKIVAS